MHVIPDILERWSLSVIMAPNYIEKLRKIAVNASQFSNP